ncbi:MAG: hypothetical protein P4K86_03805 [Terracidiphilus sp.]|nr:hypothetical protein [Terracidiphilus sp.]MDR3776848.1 hypothetical protein [Terracidiphilus sp.]
MPEPKIWKDRARLIQNLKAKWPRYASRVHAQAEWEQVIRGAISGNTFRAFRNMPAAPSAVFREWATNALLDRKALAKVRNISSIRQYDRWFNKLVLDLQIVWSNNMGTGMSFGPSYKLPNLLLKAVSEKLLAESGKDIRPFLHVAWDKYTLIGLRNVVTWPDGKRITLSSTMKSVDTEEAYNHLLQEIRAIAAEADVPAIAYDYLAWDESHRG